MTFNPMRLRTGTRWILPFGAFTAFPTSSFCLLPSAFLPGVSITFLFYVRLFPEIRDPFGRVANRAVASKVGKSVMEHSTPDRPFPFPAHPISSRGKGNGKQVLRRLCFRALPCPKNLFGTP